nr:nadph-dependent 1-acyldihydroxyacetone phosphate reductase [Quercus suber]
MPQSVLITGCSDGGLGAALALAFQDAGYRVIATARNVNKMGMMKERKIEMVQLDVLSEDSIQRAAKEVHALLNGTLDMLINNAGGGYSMPLLDVDVAEIRKLFDLNVFSLIPVSRHFFPLLRNSPRATIVNNTSIASLAHVPLQGSYNASKAAAAMLTQNLRLELKPFGINVIDLKTGAVKTNFFANVMASESGGPTLPANSVYLPGKDILEGRMRGDVLMDNAIDAGIWARQVVGDLTKKSPPLLVWRGSSAFTMWLTTFFPVWAFDGMMSNLMGLDVFQKRLRAQQAGTKRA